MLPIPWGCGFKGAAEQGGKGLKLLHEETWDSRWVQEPSIRGCLDLLRNVVESVGETGCSAEGKRAGSTRCCSGHGQGKGKAFLPEEG